MKPEIEAAFASSIAVIPVFALLIINYAVFGLDTPTAPDTYLIFGSLTVLCGVIVTSYLGSRVGLEWAIESGLLRWGVLAAAFTMKPLLDVVLFDVPGEFAQIITFQFLFEIPAMVGGYLVAVGIYRGANRILSGEVRRPD